MRHKTVSSLKYLPYVMPLLALLGGLSAAQGQSGQVPLAWDAPTTYTDGTPLTDLVSYHLHWQDPSGAQHQVDVGPQSTTTLTQLPGGATLTITATAYNSTGLESLPSAPLTVQIPLAQADTATTPKGTPVTLAVLANDSTPSGAPLYITTVTPGGGGSVSSDGTTLTYTPTATFTGTDSFTYTMTDGHGGSASAPVTVTVLAPNRPPVAQNDTATTLVGTPVQLTVLANDTDPDGNPLAVTAVTQGAHGTVTLQGGIVTYTPAANYAGTDSFTYTVTDSAGASTTATVTITVYVQVALEAETGTLTTPMEVGQTTTSPAVSYAWVPAGTANTLDPMAPGGAVQYSFTVPKADAYVIWGRVNPNTTGTGSFFIGTDVPAGNGLTANLVPTKYRTASLHVGTTHYVDSTATITALPNGFDGLGIIKTASADKKNTSATFLTFTLWQQATLYVAYDAKASAFPTWLTASFTNTGQIMETTAGSLVLWKKDVPAGPVSLPGNKYQSPSKSMASPQYVVLLDFHGAEPYVAWDITPPPGTPAAAWVWDEAAGATTPIFFLSAGSHTLTLRQRESGTKLDKLLITNNMNLIPQN